MGIALAALSTPCFADVGAPLFRDIRAGETIQEVEQTNKTRHILGSVYLVETAQISPECIGGPEVIHKKKIVTAVEISFRCHQEGLAIIKQKYGEPMYQTSERYYSHNLLNPRKTLIADERITYVWYANGLKITVNYQPAEIDSHIRYEAGEKPTKTEL